MNTFFRSWIHILSIISCIVLATGFFLGVSDILSPPTSKNQISDTTLSETNEREYLVGLGDSLTRGIGDEKGEGYLGIIRKKLEAQQKQTVKVSNLSVSGQTSSELLTQLKQSQVQQILKQAKWITLTIGGNDLNRSIDRSQKINQKIIDQNRMKYEQNLQKILSEIRRYNQQAPIYFFTLYNPYGDLADHEQTSAAVLQWNQTTVQVAQKFSHVITVPVFDLFQLNPKKYLASDHFHPNHLGYQRMAERLFQVLQDSEVTSKKNE